MSDGQQGQPVGKIGRKAGGDEFLHVLNRSGWAALGHRHGRAQLGRIDPSAVDVVGERRRVDVGARADAGHVEGGIQAGEVGSEREIVH